MNIKDALKELAISLGASEDDFATAKSTKDYLKVIAKTKGATEEELDAVKTTKDILLVVADHASDPASPTS